MACLLIFQDKIYLKTLLIYFFGKGTYKIQSLIPLPFFLSFPFFSPKTSTIMCFLHNVPEMFSACMCVIYILQYRILCTKSILYTVFIPCFYPLIYFISFCHYSSIASFFFKTIVHHSIVFMYFFSMLFKVAKISFFKNLGTYASRKVEQMYFYFSH